MPKNNFVNITADGVVIPTGGGVLEGMFVNSTTSGTVKLYHGITAADQGSPIGGVITPNIGYHYLGSLDCTAGVYADVTGTIDVTFHIVSAN